MIRLDEDFHVIPTSREEYIMAANAREYDLIFSRFPKRCSAPDCGYPIPATGNFAVPMVGEVCNLCHTMYYLVQTRDFFMRAHIKFKEDQEKRH